jgi:predicted O-methyltransferase YrrM
MAELDPEGIGVDEAIERAGRTIGYPAWNLLYFSLLCSVPADRDDLVVVETGTNHGATTIAMAQALADSGTEARLRTVEVRPRLVEVARQNVAAAGLEERVELNAGDALDFLRGVLDRFGHIDFAFIDDDHSYEHVVKELDLICPRVPPGGKVYLDNTTQGGVADAIPVLLERHGGNLVEFRECSWQPPGNAIWQAP